MPITASTQQARLQALESTIDQILKDSRLGEEDRRIVVQAIARWYMTGNPPEGLTLAICRAAHCWIPTPPPIFRQFHEAILKP